MRNEQKDLAGKKSSWIINNLVDYSLVCSIALYFHSLFEFDEPVGKSKYGTTHKNTQVCHRQIKKIRKNPKKSEKITMNLISRDDHLAAGAWAACGVSSDKLSFFLSLKVK